jgi:hypothetical protein
VKIKIIKIILKQESTLRFGVLIGRASKTQHKVGRALARPAKSSRKLVVP